VATRLSATTGPSGGDAVNMQNWILRYGKESSALREELAEWASWLANQHPPWAEYRSSWPVGSLPSTKSQACALLA
jgi:hypothetical protein